MPSDIFAPASSQGGYILKSSGVFIFPVSYPNKCFYVNLMELSKSDVGTIDTSSDVNLIRAIFFNVGADALVLSIGQ
ncbi:hypothetical protein QV05_05070 [Gallibacterium genomosp. 1]|uniref:Uncharacterized protein n=1 Tax=Gallibacterium genomosp. 1 TaxID=155515 RepID=A0AB36DWH3_9PAST|nr:hypothetical protein QV05_05070 [Gallibacterium genomosp. 1]